MRLNFRTPCTVFVVLIALLLSQTADAGNVARLIKDGKPPEFELTEHRARIVEYHQRSWVIGGGYSKPISGELKELWIDGNKIELQDQHFNDGTINTKPFGLVRVLFSASLTSSGFLLVMTQDQLKSLDDYAKTAPAEDPFDYMPVKASGRQITVPSQHGTIQGAIDVANDGDEVVVSTGTYRETLVVKKNIILTSTAPKDARIVETTVIDAEKKATALLIEGAHCVVRGFTITGGYSSNKGGGIWINGGASPLIADNVFRRNSTDMLGGAIAIVQDSQPRIVDNTIADNKAKGGAGLFADSSCPYLKGNSIEGNAAEKGGGGLWFQNCRGAISGNTITRNSAEAGAGVYISKDASPKVSGNNIAENKAEVGAAIFVIDGCTVEISGNKIRENVASKLGSGLAVAVGSEIKLQGNTFRENKAGSGGPVLAQQAEVKETDNTYIGNTPENPGS